MKTIKFETQKLETIEFNFDDKLIKQIADFNQYICNLNMSIDKCDREILKSKQFANDYSDRYLNLVGRNEFPSIENSKLQIVGFNEDYILHLYNNEYYIKDIVLDINAKINTKSQIVEIYKIYNISEDTYIKISKNIEEDKITLIYKKGKSIYLKYDLSDILPHNVYISEDNIKFLYEYEMKKMLYN